jgi:hypothetical protein
LHDAIDSSFKFIGRSVVHRICLTGETISRCG